MKILYDGDIYSYQSLGGINRYFSNIIKRLPGDIAPVLTVSPAGPGPLPQGERLDTIRFRNFKPYQVSAAARKFYFRAAESFHKFDIIHPTFYTLLSGRKLKDCKVPLVVTVWDQIAEKFPQTWDPQGIQARLKKEALETARAVICISEYTKKDMLERYPLPEAKVKVIPLASDLALGPTPEKGEVPDGPYYFYVGGRAGYKNFRLALVAMKIAVQQAKDLHLAVAGLPFSGEEEKEIAELGLAGNITNYGPVNDGRLANLYRFSLGLLYPSLYEGFGIPVLEAMNCGTVAIAANRASIPEVAGGAGVLFDPENPGELAETMVTFYKNPSQREKHIARGRIQAGKFSWDATAARTVEIYRSIS